MSSSSLNKVRNNDKFIFWFKKETYLRQDCSATSGERELRFFLDTRAEARKRFQFVETTWFVRRSISSWMFIEGGNSNSRHCIQPLSNRTLEKFHEPRACWYWILDWFLASYFALSKLNFALKLWSVLLQKRITDLMPSVPQLKPILSFSHIGKLSFHALLRQAFTCCPCSLALDEKFFGWKWKIFLELASLCHFPASFSIFIRYSLNLCPLCGVFILLCRGSFGLKVEIFLLVIETPVVVRLN